MMPYFIFLNPTNSGTPSSEAPIRPACPGAGDLYRRRAHRIHNERYNKAPRCLNRKRGHVRVYIDRWCPWPRATGSPPRRRLSTPRQRLRTPCGGGKKRRRRRAMAMAMVMATSEAACGEHARRLSRPARGSRSPPPPTPPPPAAAEHHRRSRLGHPGARCWITPRRLTFGGSWEPRPTRASTPWIVTCSTGVGTTSP